MPLITPSDKRPQVVRNIKTLNHRFIRQVLGNSCCSYFKKGVGRGQQIYSENQVIAGKKMSRSPSTHKDQVKDEATFPGIPSVEKHI